MAYLKSFIKKEGFDSTNGEYKIDDIDHPNGWDWKEIDMLYGMGFEPEGDARMVLKVRNKNHMDDYTFKVYKTDDDYVLLINLVSFFSLLSDNFFHFLSFIDSSSVSSESLFAQFECFFAVFGRSGFD